MPPPARQPTSSPASSYHSAIPTIPQIRKWTVVVLRQALINSDMQFLRRMNKAELYDLYVTLQSANLSPKSTPASKTANRQSKARRAQNSPRSTPPSSSCTRSGSLQASGRRGRPLASQFPPLQDPTCLLAAGLTNPPLTSQSFPSAVSNPFSFFPSCASLNLPKHESASSGNRSPGSYTFQVSPPS